MSPGVHDPVQEELVIHVLLRRRRGNLNTPHVVRPLLGGSLPDARELIQAFLTVTVRRTLRQKQMSRYFPVRPPVQYVVLHLIGRSTGSSST